MSLDAIFTLELLLAPEDYEIDEEHSALLLRRLLPGLPAAARGVL